MRRHVLTFSACAVLVTACAPEYVGYRGTFYGDRYYDDSYHDYILAVSSYYGVPAREVIIIHDHGIPYEELPVVYYLAERCRQSPDVIVDMRLSGWSWFDVAGHFGLTARSFYVPLSREPIGPYRGTYSRFHQAESGRHDWKSVRLRDPDIVNQVNLRFIARQYDRAPDEVARLRAQKSNFVRVHDEVKKAKERPDKPGRKFRGPRGRGRGVS